MQTQINDILHATQTANSDVSINLENQQVYVTDKNGWKRVTRTVYRVHFENGQLIGSVFRANEKQKWPPYQFDFQKRVWTRIQNNTRGTP